MLYLAGASVIKFRRGERERGKCVPKAAGNVRPKIEFVAEILLFVRKNHDFANFH